LKGAEVFSNGKGFMKARHLVEELLGSDTKGVTFLKVQIIPRVKMI
jgi:hypothetical protein